MKMDERSMELTGDLFREFEETKKIVENEDGVLYSTWSKACSQILTLVCC